MQRSNSIPIIKRQLGRRQSFLLFSEKKTGEKASFSRQHFRAATENTIGNYIIIITINCLLPILYILRNSILSSSCYLSLVKLLNLHTQRKEAIFAINYDVTMLDAWYLGSMV